MAAKKPIKERLSVNLLFPQGVPEKIPVKFLKWLVSYGRFIAIFVEIIVIVAFVARFKFDSDLSSLKDSIKNKYQYINSQADDEALVRQTQFKLATISQAYANSPDWSNILIDVAKQTPAGVKLVSVNLDHTKNTKLVQFKFVGTAATNTDLASFISSLKKVTDFKDVYLASISLDQGQITFTITGGTTN